MKRMILIAAALLAVTLSYGQKGKAAEPSGIEFSEREWDFGTVNADDKGLVHVFTFVNSGDKPFVIEEVASPCGCAVAKYTRRPVMPGGEGTVEVELDPSAFEGVVVRKGIAIYSNRKKSRDIVVVTAKVNTKKK